MKSYEEDKIISQSLHSPRQCNRAFKQSIMQLSLDAGWQTSSELFSLTGKCYGTGWKSSFEISTEKDTVLPGAMADCGCLCLCSLQYAWCKRRSQNSPPGGEIHLKFGLWGTIKTPNSVPKFKLAWNPPAAPGWLLCLLPPLSVMWHNVSDVTTQFVFAC